MVTQQQNVPALRFPEFSGAWTEKQLGAIGAIKTGPFGSLLHEKDYVDKGTPIITVEHLGELGIKHRNLPLVSAKDKERLKGYILKVDDIVFSRVGSVDRNSIVKPEEDGWLFSGRLLRIRTVSRHAHAKFLSFSFQQVHTKYKIRSVAVGQTMPSLNTNIIRFFCVFSPSSILEQQKIASFLSSVDTKIEQIDKKKALLEQYKKGMMQKLFSQEIRFKEEQGNEYPDWEENCIHDICEINPTSGSLPNTFYYIDLESVNMGILVKQTKVKKINAPSRAQRLLRKQDVLFQTVRPYQKNNYYFELNGDYVASTGYAQLRAKASSRFLFYLLHVQSVVNTIIVRCTGTSYPAINSNHLGTIKVLVPTGNEQQKIADFLSAIDKKIELVAAQLEQARTFKKGLLQQMFI